MDRDGDLVMGAASTARGASSNGHGDRYSRRGRGGSHNSRGSGHNISVDPKMLQQALVQANRPSKGPRNNPKPSYKGGQGHDTTEGLDEIAVFGLKESMAAKNAGGGISELVSWLEHKASKGASEGEMVKIKKVCF